MNARIGLLGDGLGGNKKTREHEQNHPLLISAHEDQDARRTARLYFEPHTFGIDREGMIGRLVFMAKMNGGIDGGASSHQDQLYLDLALRFWELLSFPGTLLIFS